MVLALSPSCASFAYVRLSTFDFQDLYREAWGLRTPAPGELSTCASEYSQTSRSGYALDVYSMNGWGSLHFEPSTCRFAEVRERHVVFAVLRFNG